jgi:hypothetical protein
MPLRFAAKRGENELTSCTAVFGGVGVRWDCCANGEGQQNQGFQAHKRGGWGR